jgi:pyruvate-formate lyase-activating enzyme
MRLPDAPSDQADLAATGTVFDVQRASLHDGPGIRTTVFLKGCPLRCAWCHNPESQAARPQLSFDPERCLGGRQCVTACATGVHHFDETGRHLVEYDRCGARGECVSRCPAGALRIYGETRSVGAVLGKIEKDMAYYRASGGGLTLSGGEPTMQKWVAFPFCGPREDGGFTRASRRVGSLRGLRTNSCCRSRICFCSTAKRPVRNGTSL